MLLLTNPGYPFVSIGRVADNGIETHLCRSDILLKLEAVKTVI